MSLKNLIFPSKNICLICKTADEDIKRHICPICYSNLEIVNKGVEMYSPYIETVYYSLFYNRFIREVVKDYKYNGKNYLYKVLGEIMVDTINPIGLSLDAILYIPMHRRKQAIRGYNQSELLARYISKKADIPLISNNLIKHKMTKDQSHSNMMERSTNLQNSFKIRKAESIKDKHILLVDDIVTTGSTMEEASRVLIENGAKKITGIALTSSKNN